MVALGTIVNTHGIRGELRLLPYNPATAVFRPGLEVTLRRDGRERVLRLQAARRHKSFLLVTFSGIGSMPAAEEIVGCEVAVPAEVLPPPGEGEAYHFQLVGLTVVCTSGETLGVIEEVFCTGANDVCVVRRDGREVLVPYIDDVIRRLDLERRQLLIEPLPGLLDEG